MNAAHALQACILLTALLSGPAAAQVVVCVDKDGHKEYAQKCPEGTQQKSVKIYPGVGNAPAPASEAEQEAAFRERQMLKEQNESNAAIEAKNKAVACADARERLGVLQSARGLHYDQKSGEKAGKELDDADRARETTATQNLVAKYCSR